jgi:hypothetical protein
VEEIFQSAQRGIGSPRAGAAREERGLTAAAAIVTRGINHLKSEASDKSQQLRLSAAADLTTFRFRIAASSDSNSPLRETPFLC